MRRLAPLGWAAVALALHGYAFATTDQAVQLTLVWAWLEPGRLAGDLVAEHAAAHPSLLWPLLAGLVQTLGWGVVPTLAFSAWWVALVAWMAGIQAMAETLWPGRWTWLAPALLVGWAWLPGHHQLFAPEAVARTLAAPWLIWAVVLGLRQHWHGASALVAVGLLLHGTTGTQALTVLWGLALWSRQRLAWPLLLPLAAVAWLGVRAPAGWMDEQWWAVVRWRLGHHVAPGTWPLSWWLVAGVQLGLAVFAVRRTPRLLPLLLVGVGWALLATAAAIGLRWAPLVASHGWYGWTWVALVGGLGLWPRLATLPRWSWGPVVLAVSLQVPTEWLGVERVRTWSPSWPELTEDDSPGAVPWRRVLDGVPIDVSVKDGGEVAFSRSLAMQWRERLEARCGPLPLEDLDDPRGYVRARRFAESHCDRRPAGLEAHESQEDGWSRRR